jgi:hypothetical protein
MATNMILTTKPTFGGHEKFVCRNGWLKKGVDAVIMNPDVFATDQALVDLGVGKNMVRSIRHWCLATSLCSEIVTPERKRKIQPTDLGHRLIHDNGWDPYFEDVGTLWLVHWLLTQNQERALVWQLIFSRFYDVEFSKMQLHQFLIKSFEVLKVVTTPGTIDREIDCFIRTYTPGRRATESYNEESFDCPLAELDLIRFIAQDDVYRFNVGPKPSLPDPIFAYALLHYLETIAQQRRTVGVDECVYNPGSPGQLFRLDENSVVTRLVAVSRLTRYRLRLQETAGLHQLYISADDGAASLGAVAEQLLEQYYARN